MIQFFIVKSWGDIPKSGKNLVYLLVDDWNDYGFVTSFKMDVFDENGTHHGLPAVRIGFVGQKADTATFTTLPDSFNTLPKNYFSLGATVEYYKNIHDGFSSNFRNSFLESLRDLVINQDLLDHVEDENVLNSSLLRSVSINRVRDQFVSVLKGAIELTDFDFSFELPESEKFARFHLNFKVAANSIPNTNIHAIIGRNGVGKTTILNSMVKAIARPEKYNAHFYKDNILGEPEKISGFYFKGLISVAFSAFDPFDLPQETNEGNENAPHTYIGLTDYADEGGAIIKSQAQLHSEFVEALKFCMSDSARKNRWIEAVSSLESDGNFAEMELLNLSSLDGEKLKINGLSKISKMSSGHAIVILTLTQLVAKVEEKSLVLFDEPESHLHPPLLSALMRSLSQLLHSRNAIAIIATHSPVVLQEIPKSCVWKVFRERKSASWSRPETETFGENVGTLTREVFRLEVVKSGFHTILSQLVSRGGTYQEILDKLDGQLGLEAKGVLRAMVFNRDNEEPKK